MMAHGGGGRLMAQLIEQMFAGAFRELGLQATTDAAELDVDHSRIAFTTDSFVVSPRQFPGGNIGSLAVHGTVNDLAVSGARPLYLSLGMILEEGLPMEELWSIVQSIASAAHDAEVQIVTGDTKVVDRGHGDGIFINTSGIGVLDRDIELGPAQIRPGDSIIVSGDLGRHGIAIMATREGLTFDAGIESDSAPIVREVRALLDAGIEVHCMRDLTRGGLASALNELAGVADLGMHIEESKMPVRDEVSGACEMLGLDPLYLANEGRFVAIVAATDTELALDLLAGIAIDTAPAVIGSVEETPRKTVLQLSAIGATRIVDLLSGEQLPRIC
ncbi:MAG: hydrogenase expression/formation protein HypE [Lentisphaeria bacterium]|nr:hydrogenase expression/formation protein HypE [Lentisphaeria bacterium]